MLAPEEIVAESESADETAASELPPMTPQEQATARLLYAVDQTPTDQVPDSSAEVSGAEVPAGVPETLSVEQQLQTLGSSSNPDDLVHFLQENSHAYKSYQLELAQRGAEALKEAAKLALEKGSAEDPAVIDQLIIAHEVSFSLQPSLQPVFKGISERFTNTIANGASETTSDATEAESVVVTELPTQNEGYEANQTPITPESTPISLESELRSIGEYADDPSDFSAALSRHIGEPYFDRIGGEITITSRHIDTIHEIQDDLGHAVDLARQSGSSSETVSRLVDAAFNKIGVLPSSLQAPLRNICLKYYAKRTNAA